MRSFCFVCGSADNGISTLKGYKGLCTLCESEKMDKEFDLQTKKELNLYQNKTGKKYNFNEFYFACQDKLILKDKLKKLPLLLEVYKEVEMELKNNQLSLDFINNDFPF